MRVFLEWFSPGFPSLSKHVLGHRRWAWEYSRSTAEYSAPAAGFSARDRSATLLSADYFIQLRVVPPANRHRRPTTLARAIERLMLLDAVLADSDRTWLATEQDKLGHFTLTHRIPRQDVPALTFHSGDEETARYFPDKFPIGIDRDRGTHIFLYLVTRDVPIDFRAFLERHAELLRALSAWTLRLLVPRHKRDAIPVYQAAFRE